MAALTKTINETITIKDERRGASKAVISDLTIGQGDLTYNDFQTLLEKGSAVGYEPFRSFIGGDYEYQKALFKGILKAENASIPRIIELAVNVDLPDVFDKGSAVLSASGVTTITTSRSFYYLDEVSVTMKGGTAIGMPRVTNIRTVNGYGAFDVELIDSNNSRIAGEVSWSVRGY